MTSSVVPVSTMPHPLPRVLIVGAGAAAESLLNALAPDEYTVVGLVDDSSSKLGSLLCGKPVLGKTNELPQLVEQYRITEVFIAIPSATTSQMLHLLSACAGTSLSFQAVSALASDLTTQPSVPKLHTITLARVLTWEPTSTSHETFPALWTGKTVMVTGAAGSIGSQLCRRILEGRPRKLICVDRAETPLFYLGHLLGTTGHSELVYSLADVADTNDMRILLSEHPVDTIIHAAAYKHVPLAETSPFETLKNNVFPLIGLLQAANEAGCKDFLLLSSDKAVDPRSVMGCTKRLGEMIIASQASPMRCFAVRFGNVLGSQGSVIPIFEQQILGSDRLEITHPEMTRYFISIPEAVSMILRSFAVGQPGDTLLLDMGKPLQIAKIAQLVIWLSGKHSGEVGIAYTGARPGEKLHEQLFRNEEAPIPTVAPGISRIQHKPAEWEALTSQILHLQEVALTRDGPAIRTDLRQIIPEFCG